MVIQYGVFEIRVPYRVIPGRHRQVASPESIRLGQCSWIPGSPHPISGLPEIGTIGCAHRQQPMCDGAPE